MNNQAKIMFLSFIYFANILEENKEVPKRLMNLYRVLGKITKMYEHKLESVLEDVNEYLSDYRTVDIDILLASVTIIAEFYDQTKGKKRYFYPMTYSQILDLQDECLALDDTLAKNTFDYCEFIVKKLLEEK